MLAKVMGCFMQPNEFFVKFSTNVNVKGEKAINLTKNMTADLTFLQHSKIVKDVLFGL